MTTPSNKASDAPRPATGLGAGELLQEGRARERAGCVPEAIEHYVAAVATAQRSGAHAIQAEALRRLSVLRHHQGESGTARELCQKSFDVALSAGNELLAAESLNTLGGLQLQGGALREARDTFQRALVLGGHSRTLRARVEQNLGILANIRGDLEAATLHYARSLESYRDLGDEHGCALAFHNLGMVSGDRELWDQAESYFTQSLSIARAKSDAHLEALCLVNHAEVYFARQRYEDARGGAEAALVIFDQLGAHGAKADAYRVIGMVYRETGRTALAESRLRSAMRLAASAGSALSEAEAARELALLYESMGRTQEALSLLSTAHRLFRRVDARVDLINVARKIAALEATYLAVAGRWAQSIASVDSHRHRQCDRVASHARAVGRELGLDEHQQMAIGVGAYLHDVGNLRVPHEILNKPGPLAWREREIIQMHTIWGIEQLATVEFPWDIKPIIRWHHERYNGTGYPDQLRVDEIPALAQVVGIVDVFDALTTTRPYRRALTRRAALEEIQRCRSWWSDSVLKAFLRVTPQVFGETSGVNWLSTPGGTPT